MYRDINIILQGGGEEESSFPLIFDSFHIDIVRLMIMTYVSAPLPTSLFATAKI